jgi:hypothetical protein
MDSDGTVPVERYNCITEFEGQNVRDGGIAIYERNNVTWQRRRLNYLLQIYGETSVQQSIL